MKTNSAAIPAFVLAMSTLSFAQAQAPAKVATIHIQQAIISTKDGQNARKNLETRFTPKKNELEKKQSDLANLQEQLKKGGTTMSDAAKDKITRDIDSLNKSITREGEDFESEVQQEEGKIMNDLGGKMMEVVSKYAMQNGYAMVIDVSNPQSPVLWRDQAIDITAEAIKLYDQAHPGTGAAAPVKPTNPPAGAAKPSTPPPSSTKPPATPPAPQQKKQ